MNEPITVIQRCYACKEQKPVMCFAPGKRGPNSSTKECRPCSAEGSKRRRRKKREEVLKHYGGSCACCGEIRFEFLAIDHIDGSGAADRRADPKKSGSKFMNWIQTNGFPSGFRVLCHNCNVSLGIYGYCPHQNTPVAGQTGHTA